MKVVAVNGSPRKGGNVAQCLDVMAAEFAKEGIEFEVLQPGREAIRVLGVDEGLGAGVLGEVEGEEAPGAVGAGPAVADAWSM